MKQILQSFRTGETFLEEIPVPRMQKGSVLIKTSRSLVSLGTERMLVEFGKSNLVSKARQQPDKVKQVLDKIKAEGLVPTMEAVFNKLEQPLPLGYCNVGRIISVGEGVTGFTVGDRVASNGPHAEYVSVPKNLVTKIPVNVTDEEAVFTVIGSIGLQGIRLCNPTFGETIVVTGLGLIGLLTSQMLLASGCKVIGIDIDSDKCTLAQKWGVKTINPLGNDPVKVVTELTCGVGADGVIITASAKTNDIISQAARMSRKRGRIVLVGVVDLDISRAEFYEKELTFQVSCSYGPGRYDEDYEQRGQDYPLPFVRWTENRNLQAILETISSGKLNVKDLVTEVVDLGKFSEIYGNIGSSKSIASILKYPHDDISAEENQTVVELGSRKYAGQKGVLGIIGAGNFTKMTMLPALKKTGANFKYIASSGGVTGTALAKKFGFTHSTSDYKTILDDTEVDTVLITTRHNSHAKLVVESLSAGKNVFVEKPLALNNSQLEEIIQTYSNSNTTLTVGFNRRFSPHMGAIHKAVGNNPGPLNIVATMNAGMIPSNVWVHDLEVGGGRIIGEACHFLDLVVYLGGSLIKSICMNALGENPAETTDNATLCLKLENGTNAVINYFSNGSKAYSKERIEVYSQERVFICDNFIKTVGHGAKGFKGLKTRLDKGHKKQFSELINRLQHSGDPLIPFDEIINVTKASFAAIKSLREKRWVDIA
ncbi:MAG: Gfo/Idh/MocA family oxidoreductase [Mariniphaga sp.]|nr:Gfo/Idh/MocA family oxidoreductase [Mariniphaga sp.]